MKPRPPITKTSPNSTNNLDFDGFKFEPDPDPANPPDTPQLEAYIKQVEEEERFVHAGMVTMMENMMNELDHAGQRTTGWARVRRLFSFNHQPADEKGLQSVTGTRH